MLSCIQFETKTTSKNFLKACAVQIDDERIFFHGGATAGSIPGMIIAFNFILHLFSLHDTTEIT